MTNPTEPALYRVIERAPMDSGGLPGGLSWCNYHYWTWTGKNWKDEQGIAVTDLSLIERWEELGQEFA